MYLVGNIRAICSCEDGDNRDYDDEYIWWQIDDDDDNCEDNEDVDYPTWEKKYGDDSDRPKVDRNLQEISVIIIMVIDIIGIVIIIVMVKLVISIILIVIDCYDHRDHYYHSHMLALSSSSSLWTS